MNLDTGRPEDELTPEALELCSQLGSKATRVSEIAGGRDPAVNAAIQEGINRVNEKATSNAQRIQKWVILDRDFSIGEGELGECDMNGFFYLKAARREKLDTFLNPQSDSHMMTGHRASLCSQNCFVFCS